MDMTEDDRKRLIREFNRVCPREGTLTEMPFGKFKGWKIVKLPNWYISDLAQQAFLRPNLRTAVDGELLRRLQTPRTEEVG